MPRALPVELRERIARAHIDQGMGVNEIAEVFHVSVASVRRYIAKASQGKSLAPAVPPGVSQKLGDKEYEWLRQELADDPYTTSYELANRYNRKFRSNQVHRSTILRAIGKLGFSYKKNSNRAPTRTR